MNGRPWLPAHDNILKERAGKETDAKIGLRTGHAEVTVRKRREAMGLRGYCGRPAWTRRDWLLHSITGLDFQISD